MQTKMNNNESTHMQWIIARFFAGVREGMGRHEERSLPRRVWAMAVVRSR
jgi:hypothetical protein